MFCLHQRQFCSTLIGVDVCEWVCTGMGMYMMYICVHTWGGQWVMLRAPIYQSLSYLLRQGSYGNPTPQNQLDSLASLSCRPAYLSYSFLGLQRWVSIAEFLAWVLGNPNPSLHASTTDNLQMESSLWPLFQSHELASLTLISYFYITSVFCKWSTYLNRN